MKQKGQAKQNTKKELKETQKKPNRRNKNNSTIYMIKKKTNGKMVAHKVGKQERSWNHSIWVPKDVIANMKGPQMVCVPKETWSPRTASGDLETWLTRRCDDSSQRSQAHSLDICCPFPHKIMVARFQFNHHVAPLPLLGCLHCIA